MKALLLAAALFAPVTAHAGASYDDAPGHFVDARHHMDLKYVAVGSDADARLTYAKTACGATHTVSAKLSCMKANGYAWLADSAEDIAFAQKAAQDAQMRATGYAIGQALLGAAAAMQPHGCNGNIQPSGSFTTRCY